MPHFENHSISSHFALATLKAAHEQNLDVERILLAAHLDPALLKNDKFRLTPSQFGTLARMTWELGNDEFMARARRPAPYGTFSLYAREAVRAESLEKAYRHLCRFYKLVNDSIRVELDIEPKQAVLSMTLAEPDKDQDHMLRDFLLMLWHRFPSWLIGRRIPLFEVQFAGERPDHADEYRLMFPCPVSYNAEADRLIFDNTVLQAPIIQRVETLREHLRTAPLQWFTRQEYVPVFTRRVRDLLSSDLATQADMGAIATYLNMTERTLRRKLKDEGTTFQTIKDDLRRDNAIHQLNQSGLSIVEIAQQLGFSEPAAFNRAFKQWTGQTPGAFRSSAGD